jgi:hypothetical protein
MATAASAETETRRKRDLKRFLVPGLIAALVLAIALAGTLGLLLARESETEPAEVGSFLADAKPEVEDRVVEVVNLLTNYDATDIDQVVERMLEITTGSFREDYGETFEQGFAEAIKEASTSARGQILTGPDVSFRSPDEAVAVLRVQQTIQNNRLPEGRSYVDVMQITLINTAEGGWKADRVEILGGQES